MEKHEGVWDANTCYWRTEIRAEKACSVCLKVLKFVDRCADQSKNRKVQVSRHLGNHLAYIQLMTTSIQLGVWLHMRKTTCVEK